jgi:hypothetical protein
MTTCECDFDCVGDPPHYVRSNPSTLCLEHDMCQVCDEAKAILIVDGDKCCKACALEEITVCPNCGWEVAFERHYAITHDRQCGSWEDEWLVCNHCHKRTDEEEVQRVNEARRKEIAERLARFDEAHCALARK